MHWVRFAICDARGTFRHVPEYSGILRPPPRAANWVRFCKLKIRPRCASFQSQPDPLVEITRRSGTNWGILGQPPLSPNDGRSGRIVIEASFRQRSRSVARRAKTIPHLVLRAARTAVLGNSSKRNQCRSAPLASPHYLAHRAVGFRAGGKAALTFGACTGHGDGARRGDWCWRGWRVCSRDASRARKRRRGRRRQRRRGFGWSSCRRSWGMGTARRMI